MKKTEFKKLSTVLMALSMMLVLLSTISIAAPVAADPTDTIVTNIAELEQALQDGATNILIPLGSTVTINHLIAIYSVTLTNYGTINTEYLLINCGGTIVNNGIINNNNQGIITNADDGIINNKGIINNNGQGTIYNDKGIINNLKGGIINNNDNGVIDNLYLPYWSRPVDGIYIIKVGTINNDGTINNNDNGIINNSGDCIINNNIRGIINNNDNGIIINNGIINNNDGFISGTIYEDVITKNGAYYGGVINNNGNGVITNAGIINNDGTINSSGTINNNGIINNNIDGVITNLEGGVINNNVNGVINNKGIITNNGTLNNYGTIANVLTLHITIIGKGNTVIDKRGIIINNGRINRFLGSVISTNGVAEEPIVFEVWHFDEKSSKGEPIEKYPFDIVVPPKDFGREFW